jgi:hypothetical protein
MSKRTLLFCAVLSGLGSGVNGCNQPSRFETINKRDRLLFAACRHDVARHICPDDPDCAVRASDMFAAEPYRSRRRWLLDHGCPKDKVQKVWDMVDTQERKQSGVE